MTSETPSDDPPKRRRVGTESWAMDLDESDDPMGRLQRMIEQQDQEPMLFYHPKDLTTILSERNTFAMAVPEVRDPDVQVQSELFVCTTSPGGPETWHYHEICYESYFVHKGIMRLECRWFWDDEIHFRVCPPGSLSIVRPGVAHKVDWLSEAGICIVHRSLGVAGDKIILDDE